MVSFTNADIRRSFAWHGKCAKCTCDSIKCENDNDCAKMILVDYGNNMIK